MLRKMAVKYVNKEMTLSQINEEMSRVIKLADRTDNYKLLGEYFGDNALNNYFAKGEDFLFAIKLHEHYSKEDDIEYQTKSLTTTFLNLGLGYASSNGNLNLARHFIKEYKLSPKLKILGNNQQEFLNHKKQPLKGTPFRLAAENNHLSLVKYFVEDCQAIPANSKEKRIRRKTPLMKAAQNGHFDVVSYLLEQGANPNDQKLSILGIITPLRCAIKSRNSTIVRRVIKGGAKILVGEIVFAILNKLDLATIEFLYKNCSEQLTSKNTRDFYLAAIQAGNVEVAEFFESELTSLPDRHDMLVAAARGGNVDMVRYLVMKFKLPLRHYIIHSMMIVSSAASAPNNIPLLQYLFEELQTPISSVAIEKLLKDELNVRAAAYLLSFVPQSPAVAETYRDFALHLPEKNRRELFRFYNMYFGHWKAQLQLRKLIDSKTEGLTVEELKLIIGDDKEAAIGAAFYCCQLDKHPELIEFILDHVLQLKNVDIQDYKGDTLLSEAARYRSNNIVALLLKRNANPDLPNKEGETPANYCLEHELTCSFNLMDKNLRQYGYNNTLKFASKRILGGYNEVAALLKFTGGEIGDLSVQELVMNAMSDPNRDLKLKAFLNFLSEPHACEMVALLKDDKFLDKHPDARFGAFWFFTHLSRDDSAGRLKKVEQRLASGGSIYNKTGSPVMFGHVNVSANRESENNDNNKDAVSLKNS